MHVDLFQPKLLSKDFLLCEYERYYSEIREVNRMTLEYIKVYITLVTAVFVYSFGGFLYYEELKIAAGGKFFFAYSLFGILLMAIVIVITAFFFVELAGSKKSKTRYWKLLDILRGHIKLTFPELAAALPLPPHTPPSLLSGNERPNVGNKDAFGSVIIGLCAEAIWLVILVYFLTNALDSVNSIENGRLIKALAIANIVFIAIVLLTPFQLLRVRKMFKEARMISAENIYPKYPYGVHSQKTHYGLIGVGATCFLVVATLIVVRPNDFYHEWSHFWRAFAVIGAFDMFFGAIAIAYYLQKRLSSNAIFEYWKEGKGNPQVVWRRFVWLELSTPKEETPGSNNTHS